jgi:hypothetical protein
LIVVAGRRGHYRELIGTPVADVLPVRLTGTRAVNSQAGHPFRVRPTQDGLTHLATRLVGGEAELNRITWSRLPEVRWYASVGELAPGATCLLEHPRQLAGAARLPLLAVQRVGTGKVMFSGIEGSWRWRKAVGHKYHYRFWAQIVRWMARTQFAEGDSPVKLSVSRPECDVGESVELEAHCLDKGGFPLSGAEVELVIERPDGRTERLGMEPAPGGWGLYRARFRPARAGAYRIRPVVSEYGPGPQPAEVGLEVLRPDLEKYYLAQNLSALKAIAAASGGQYLSIGQIDELPQLLAARIRERSLHAEFSPCRHWAFYVALSSALAGAWLIRKRSGLA